MSSVRFLIESYIIIHNWSEYCTRSDQLSPNIPSSNMAQPPSSGVQIAAGGNQFLYGVQPVVQRQSLDSSGGSSDFMAGLGNSNLSAGSNVSGYSASSGSNQDAQNASTGSGYNPDSNTAGVNQSSSSGGTRVSQMSKYSDSP